MVTPRLIYKTVKTAQRLSNNETRCLHTRFCRNTTWGGERTMRRARPPGKDNIKGRQVANGQQSDAGRQRRGSATLWSFSYRHATGMKYVASVLEHIIYLLLYPVLRIFYSMLRLFLLHFYNIILKEFSIFVIVRTV